MDTARRPVRAARARRAVSDREVVATTQRVELARRIYVSMPGDRWLPDNLNELKWGIVDEIAKLDYTPEVFTNPKGMPGLASSMAWSPSAADEVARRCVGAVVLGMPRWTFRDTNGPVVLPTEYNHYEGALVRTLGLPTLVLVQKDLHRRVVFDGTFGGYLGEFDPAADVRWLHTEEFRVPFQYWKRQLDDRRDVFLGYCSSSQATAAAIKEYTLSLGANVLDWQTDFIPGRTILDQIEQAAARSVGGIFLFTNDDDLADNTSGRKAVPRDNVVFEAGYFIGLKGKKNVLIVREHGSKMPADLGGDIYASLENKNNIDPIRRTISAFLRAF